MINITSLDMERMTKIGIYGMAVWMLSACGNGTPDFARRGTRRLRVGPGRRAAGRSGRQGLSDAAVRGRSEPGVRGSHPTRPHLAQRPHVLVRRRSDPQGCRSERGADRRMAHRAPRLTEQPENHGGTRFVPPSFFRKKPSA